jgi:hypothetical protein
MGEFNFPHLPSKVLMLVKLSYGKRQNPHHTVRSMSGFSHKTVAYTAGNVLF